MQHSHLVHVAFTWNQVISKRIILRLCYDFVLQSKNSSPPKKKNSFFPFSVLERHQGDDRHTNNLFPWPLPCARLLLSLPRLISDARILPIPISLLFLSPSLVSSHCLPFSARLFPFSIPPPLRPRPRRRRTSARPPLHGLGAGIFRGLWRTMLRVSGKGTMVLWILNHTDCESLSKLRRKTHGWSARTKSFNLVEGTECRKGVRFQCSDDKGNLLDNPLRRCGKWSQGAIFAAYLNIPSAPTNFLALYLGNLGFLPAL